MSLISTANGPAPSQFYYQSISGGGGGSGIVTGLLGSISGSVATTAAVPLVTGSGGITCSTTASGLTISISGGGSGIVTGLIGSASGSVATTVAAPLITGQGDIVCTTTASGLNISNVAAGGAVSSIIAQGEVYWTQQTFIPSSGNNQSIRLEVGGTGAVSGNLSLPAAISTGLSNSNYSTLRIDGVLPIYEDQGDGSGVGNYFQTALAAAGTDVSGNMCFPATQFHPILSVSGMGLPGDSGLLLSNSCFSYPFSLVLTKNASSVTTDTTAVTFLLTSTSSSNSKFYSGSSVASANNICPMVFTLTP